MNHKRSEIILREVLSLPTAPFAEHHVSAYIRDFVARRPNLHMRVDAVGNILVHYRRGKKRIAHPVCLTAHVDHPGFVAEGMAGSGRLRAQWHGGVPCEYFPDAKVRFYSDGRWIRGRVSSVVTVRRDGHRVVKSAKIDVSAPVTAGSPGMWDFPDAAIRGSRVRARACDDLAGVAAMLACMDSISARRPAGEAYFLFTRAEEVGFVGAMAACKLKTIPKRCVVVAVETSSERVDARMGAGPILRVGDKRSTFTSAATAFCAAVADDLAGRRNGFVYRRKLMDGGTCESSAYCQLGYDATGICVALGNYHNVNAAAKRLGPEFIDVTDYHRLVEWFIAMATTKRRYTRRDDGLNSRLEALRKRYATLLKRPVDSRP